MCAFRQSCIDEKAREEEARSTRQTRSKESLAWSADRAFAFGLAGKMEEAEWWAWAAKTPTVGAKGTYNCDCFTCHIKEGGTRATV
jgi:hypothetical protein